VLQVSRERRVNLRAIAAPAPAADGARGVQVVVAAKNVKGIPPYFATSYPDCGQHAGQRNTSQCLAAAPYSVHDIRRRAGLFELVAAPLGICSEAGLKSPGLRHLVNNVTRPLFERNILPASPRLPDPPLQPSLHVHSRSHHRQPARARAAR
jgi:hypothetical protein